MAITWQNVQAANNAGLAAVNARVVGNQIDIVKDANPFGKIREFRKDNRDEAIAADERQFKRGSDLLARQLTGQQIDAGEFTANNREALLADQRAKTVSGLETDRLNQANQATVNKFQPQVIRSGLNVNAANIANTNQGTANLVTAADIAEKLRVDTNIGQDLLDQATSDVTEAGPLDADGNPTEIQTFDKNGNVIRELDEDGYRENARASGLSDEVIDATLQKRKDSLGITKKLATAAEEKISQRDHANALEIANVKANKVSAKTLRQRKLDEQQALVAGEAAGLTGSTLDEWMSVDLDADSAAKTLAFTEAFRKGLGEDYNDVFKSAITKNSITGSKKFDQALFAKNANNKMLNR